MNQTDTARPKSLWRIPLIAAGITAVLLVLSFILDTGDAHARDLALLIGAPTLWILLPATVAAFAVALVLRVRRRPPSGRR